MNRPLHHIRTKQCKVHPALARLIRHIVVIDTELDKNSMKLEGHFMPSPDQAMFINLFAPLKSKRSGEYNFRNATSCTLIGPQITPFKLLVEEDHKVVSIIFHPGGLNRFLGIPMTELFDDGYSAREVIGKEIDELLNKAHDTASADPLGDIVQHYFLKRLYKVRELLPVDLALQHLLANYSADMDSIAAMACMSIRSFERKCKERLGMPAKTYARIARFYKAYKLLENSRISSWASLAYEVGYYDQAHFIRDFREFGGLTPTLLQKDLSGDQMRFQLDWDRA